MPTNYITCSECQHEFADTARECPHCGRPAIYVNVIRAERDIERKALQVRYDAAIADAKARGCEDVVRDFEQAIANTKAVVARPGHVLRRMISTDTEIYGTYEQELRAGLRLPKGENWDLLRRVAGSTLFGEASAQIRFAALTLDETGLFNYGDYVLFFREDMIAHRASVFEENSALFVDRHRRTTASAEAPPGYRAIWSERAALCVAKLASEVGPSTKPQKYAKILLNAAANSADDVFVEVHVCGPVTIRSLERVAVRKCSVGRSKAIRNELVASLKKFKVDLDII